MAVSPRPDAQGQSFLAVAGYGIEARRGDITVFRIPGLVRTPTGEVVTRMFPPPDGQPQAIGHIDTVNCLAFNPTGRVLASGSTDTTIILWDVPAFRPRAVLRGHTRAGPRARLQSRRHAGWPPAALTARCGSGTSPRASGSNPGRATPIAPTRSIPWLTAPIGSGSSSASNRRAALPVPGQEHRAGSPRSLPTGAAQGPVECVAFHPDAQAAAAGRQHQERPIPGARPHGDVLRRRDPRHARRHVVHCRRVTGLVHALAFSPDGRRLAYAGGTPGDPDRRSGRAEPAPPRDPRRGEHAVRRPFLAGQQVIGFTRDFDPANPPRRTRVSTWSGSELTVARNDLPAWRDPGFPGLEPPAEHQSPACWPRQRDNGQSRAFPIDRRWSARRGHGRSSRPAGPPAATVAIGTESGVAVFDFETGTRTRVYAGHSSPVVSLAPSPDGRWLASGSMDQTVLLYPLDGCDTRAPLGATFRPRADGVRVVVGRTTELRRRHGPAPRRRARSTSASPGAPTTSVSTTPAEIEEFFRLLPRAGALPVQDRHQGPPDVDDPDPSARSHTRPRCRPPGATTRRWPCSWGRTGSGCSGRPRATMTRRSKGTRGSSAGTSTRRSGRPGRPTSCRSARSPRR